MPVELGRLAVAGMLAARLVRGGGGGIEGPGMLEGMVAVLVPRSEGMGLVFALTADAGAAPGVTGR